VTPVRLGISPLSWTNEAEQDPRQAPPKEAVAFGLAHLVRAFANARKEA
jgi:hypothetical protein